MPEQINLKIVLVLFLFLMPEALHAQYTKYGKMNGHYVGGMKLTKQETALATKYSSCNNSHKYTAKQRRTFFPFSKSETVKLISFSLQSDVNDPTDTEPPVYTPVTTGNYKINYKRIKESKELSAVAIDSLTDIMYNVGYTPLKLKFRLSDPGASCYNPHNAILFIDAKGIVTEYIEICFECQRYYLSSSKIKNTEYCEQKFDMLRAFFLNQNIKFGATLREIQE